MESNQLKLTISPNNDEIELYIQPYRLELRNPFGTAHSLTTVRNNALITISIKSNGKEIKGFGESGLPPKKKYCYLADYNDILEYFTGYIKQVESGIKSINSSKYDPFQSLPNEYFQSLRSSNTESLPLNSIFYYLFECLDNCHLNEKDFSFPARSSIEMALLDAWGKSLNLPIYKMIRNDINLIEDKKPFYYTVSLSSMDEIIKSTDFGIKYTRYLKVKLDQDIEKCMKIIVTVLDYLKEKNLPIQRLSVDANSSWTPAIAMQYLVLLEPYKNIISMVEQPFPIELLKGDNINRDIQLQEWIQVKSEYQKSGLLIFADESVSNHNDIDYLLPLVHGVNIKLEKAGGIRESLKTILKAKSMDLKVWIGCMVASSLNVSSACHLLSLFSDFGGDLDGGLLINDETQLFTNDSFTIDNSGLIQLNNNHGIGVLSK